MRNRNICSIIIFLCVCFIMPNDSVSAKEQYRYLALGDSITAGYALENPEADRYTTLVSLHLQSLFKNKEVISENQAVSGIKSQQLLDMLDDSLLSSKVATADLITISIGSNDYLKELSANLSNYSGKVTDFKTMDTITEQLEKNLERLYEKIFTMNPDVKLIMIPYYNPYIDLIQNDSLITRFQEIKAQFIKQVDSMNKKYHTITTSSELGKILEDIEYLNVSLRTGSVDPHPNIDGHIVIAEEVNQLIDNLYHVKQADNVLEDTKNFYEQYKYYIIGSLLVILLLLIHKMRRMV